MKKNTPQQSPQVSDSVENIWSLSLDVDATISSIKVDLETTLDNASQVYHMLREIENTTKWYLFRQDTVDYIFQKYPGLNASDFKKIFLNDTYNKNILRCHPEIIDYIDLNSIEAGCDLIEIIIEKISLAPDIFQSLTDGKIDKITVPNMSSTDVAQWYFKSKLESFLPNTEIIFWNMPEIKENLWYNQISADSVWFIDLLWNGPLNSCLFKLFQTQPDPKKVKAINELFESITQNIFIWWSTFVIPFQTPEELKVVKMPKMVKNDKNLQLSENGILHNSMGYLNSAYYSKKVKWSFVLWSHNIAEPMHAGKLTVINNDTENRYNHNWLVSYFWEKTGLLMYTGEKLNNNDELQQFLSIDDQEVVERNQQFKKIYESKIIPLVYWIFYRNLHKTFPDKIKAI